MSLPNPDDENSCQAAVNGSGGLALSTLDDPDPLASSDASRAVFYLAPDGSQRGTRQSAHSSQLPMLGRLSTFLDFEKDASGADVLVAQDERGNVLRSAATGVPAALAEDPLGGAMVTNYDQTAPNHPPVTLTSFDANAVQRFRVMLSPSDSGTASGLAVDRLGNTLIIMVAADSSTFGQWVTHDGVPGTAFRLLGPSGVPLNQVVPRVGGGLFFRRDNEAWLQLDSLSTTVVPGPAWLNAVTSSPFSRNSFFVARNGRAYAVVSVPMHECSDEVEVFAPDGESCGKAAFPSSTGRCGGLQVGFDGTLVRTDQGCTGTTCTCSFQWWTGFFH